MGILGSPQALKEFQYWKATDSKKVAKLKQLLANILETPFSRIGKPEPLKHEKQGL